MDKTLSPSEKLILGMQAGYLIRGAGDLTIYPLIYMRETVVGCRISTPKIDH